MVLGVLQVTELHICAGRMEINWWLQVTELHGFICGCGYKRGWEICR